MRKTITGAALVGAALLLARTAPAQHDGCPMHARHEAEADRRAGVDHRGDEVMGFDHARTAHHFLLTKDGGVIEVTANDAKDADSVAAIRRHLAHVAEAFAKGDFSMPHAIHAKVPPGVPALAAAKAAVSYAFEPIERGGRVALKSSGKEAIAAIHEFLVFQIRGPRDGGPEDAALKDAAACA